MSISGPTYPKKDIGEGLPSHVVTVGLFADTDLRILVQGLRRVYRTDAGHDFDVLLAAIDAAERDCAS